MTWKDWEHYEPPSSLPTGTAAKKRSKYGADPQMVDGVKFDSKREADRYQALKLEQLAGEIADLELQPQYPLHAVTPSGTRIVIGRYIADFRYTRKGGGVIVEDAKGFRGKELYLWKKRHVETEYAIHITEV